MTSLLIWRQPVAKVFKCSVGVTQCVFGNLFCIRLYQLSTWDVNYCKCGFTEHSWQTQEWLPGTAVPSHPPCPFSPKQLSCCVTMEIHDWLCWNALIIMENDHQLIKYAGMVFFFCLFSFPWLSRRGERPRISWGLWKKVDASNTNNKKDSMESLLTMEYCRKLEGQRVNSWWQPKAQQHNN